MKRHHTHILLIALLTALAGTVRAQQLVDGWKKVATGAQGNLYDVCCIDADNIWVCAQDGGLLKSSDGGETWTRKHTEEGFAMSRIKFANENVGYAMGVREQRDMVLLRTDDAGETWTRVADTALDAVAIGRDEWRYGDWQMIGTDTLYVFESQRGGWARLYGSTDGGHSFHNYANELPYGSFPEYADAVAIGLHFEDNEGYCVYSVWDDEVLRAFRTTDYGQTWTRHTLFENDDEHYCNFRTAQIHIVNNLEARLFHPSGYFDTHDGFANANLIESYFYNCYPSWNEYPPDIKFTDDRHGCVTGARSIPIKANSDDYVAGYAVITNDGGETWEMPTMNGMDNDSPVFAVDGVDTTFYLASGQGVVYKRGLITIQSVMESETPSWVTVLPTLTDGTVTLTGKSLREATVYNTLGQLVLTKKEDADAMTLDLSGQPSGLYFISVTDHNGQRCVKKIVKQ